MQDKILIKHREGKKGVNISKRTDEKPQRYRLSRT